MNKNTILMILLFVIVLTLTACTSKVITNAPSTDSGGSKNNVIVPPTPTAEEESANIKTIKIDSYNFGFDVVGPAINVGDKVKIVVSSREGVHGIAIPELNINLKPIGPGEQQEAEFIAEKSGTFEYYCNVPCGAGHKSMRGQIVVN